MGFQSFAIWLSTILLVAGFPAIGLAHHETADAPVLTYSVTAESWSPYWIVTEHGTSGILNDVLHEVDRRTDFKLSPSAVLPIKRAQKAFSEGHIGVECCVNKSWREAAPGAEFNRWSDVVISVREVLIFPKGQSFQIDSLENLKGKTIATVLGYGYVGDEYFERSDSPDKFAVLTKVAAGRVDAAIMDSRVFNFISRTRPAAKALLEKIELGQVINESDLHVRIHSQHEDRIIAFNEAIAHMKDDGTLDYIIRNYTLD